VPAGHHENFKRETPGFYVMQNPCVMLYPHTKELAVRQCPHILFFPPPRIAQSR